MSRPRPTNHAASAYAKLKNIAHEHNMNFMSLLIRYATERFLYRLSIADAAGQFVLKGGNLFVIWQKGQTCRPTVDADLLCFGNAEPGHLREVFLHAASAQASINDGMRFDTNSIRVSAIREESEYGGTRITLNGFLTAAKIPLQFDIGVGDAITPPPALAEYPVLLGGLVPRLKVYPMATAIAEKAETMVTRGVINSRMKDFYDLWLLAELFDHDYATLRTAISSTFERRRVPMPSTTPDAWTAEFAASPIKTTQWSAFLRKHNLQTAPVDFASVIARIALFLGPVFFPPARSPITWQAANNWK